jgi:hypothetical protein
MRFDTIKQSREPSRTRSRKARPSLDVLEDRLTLSTFRVTNTLDAPGRPITGSLRWAIAQANRAKDQDSVVKITPAALSSPGGNTIRLRGGELHIRNSMTIENDAGAPVTIRQETRDSRVIHVVSNPRTTLVTIAGTSHTSALTVTGGFARDGNGGGILVDNPASFLLLQDVNVTGNTAAQVTNPSRGTGGSGGGVYSRGTVTLDHSSVSNNTARGRNSVSHGGGTYTDQGITLVSSHVDGNTAFNAAGLFNVFGSVEVLDGSTVNNNKGTANSFKTGSLGGGGIGQMYGNVMVSDSQVNNNKTVGMYSGGIVLLIGGATVTNGSQVDGNTDGGPGGGIAANFGGAVVVSKGSQVDGNRGVGLGGGIVNFSETFGITVASDSEVANNMLGNAELSNVTAGLVDVGRQASIRGAFLSGGRGDAMLAAALRLFANACSQRVPLINAAVAALPHLGKVPVGAGIASVLAGPILIADNSRILNNKFVSDSSAAVIGTGGGVFGNLCPITIADSTISGNNAPNDGGGIWNGATLTIRNSRVTRNTTHGHGGGIFDKGTLHPTNNDISENTPDDVYP